MLSALGALVMAVGLSTLLLEHAVVSGNPAVIVCQAAAVAVMVWARMTFGRRSFHATAEPTEGGLVTSGPYRLVRHPIYSSVCLFTWASALGHPSSLSIALASLVTLGAATRIASEERLLRERYPDYAAYAGTTKRLIPFVY